MNETKIVIFGLIALVIAVILSWVLDEPEILVDKEIEMIIALGAGLLILILDRRADRRIHEIIHEQHLLINEMHKKIDEQNELIKNIQKTSSSHKDHVSNKDSY
jgi:flagellar motor component MotA